jgi:hypothetical protein
MLLGTLFGIIAFSLVKLAVPAMGAFTNSIAANAAASQKAHADYVSKSKLRIKLTIDEHNKWVAIQQDKVTQLAILAMKETQAGPTGKVTAGGKVKTKELERALNKDLINQETGIVNIVARKQIIEGRIAQMKTKQGVARKNLSADSIAELALLEKELLLHGEIAVLETTKKVNTGEVVAGEVAHITALRLKKKELLSTGLATVVASAETQGYSAAVTMASLELQNMAWQAALAGVELTALDKILFMTKARLTAAGVAAQGFWMKLLGPFSILLLFLPALLWLNKLLGIGSEQAENLSKANTAAADAYGKLGRRIEHAREQQAKMTDTTLTAHQRQIAFNKGQESFAEGVLTTIKALNAQNDALIEYKDNASGWAQFWGETVPTMFGKGTANALKKGKNELIEGIQEAEELMSPAMKKAIARLEKASRPQQIGKRRAGNAARQKEMLDAELAVIALAEKEATAFQTARSAIDGAKESAKDFTDSLIISTDVDKPLSTFRQIKAVLEDTALTQDNIRSYQKEIAEDAAIMALLTREEKEHLKRSSASIKDYKMGIDGIVKTYTKQQNLLILSKTTLEQISALQKNITGLTKESTAAIKLKFEIEKETAELNIQVAKIASRNARSQTEMTRDRIAQLSAAEDIMGLLTDQEATEENLALIQAAINAHRKEEILLMDEAFASATRQLREEEAILEMSLKRLGVEEKLNSLKLEAFKNEQKIANFMKKGTIKLDPAEELKAIIKSEAVRMKTALSRKNLEMEILRVRTNTIGEEWKLLWEKRKHSGIEDARAEKELALNRYVSKSVSIRKDTNLTTQQQDAKIEKELNAYESRIKVLDARIDLIQNAVAKGWETTTDFAAFEAAAAAQAEIIEQQFENMAQNYLISLLGQLEKMRETGGSGLVSPMQGTAMSGLNKMTGTQDFIKEAQSNQKKEAATYASALVEQLKMGSRDALTATDDSTLEQQQAKWDALTVSMKKARKAKEDWAQAEGAAEIQLFTNAIRQFSAAVATLGEEGMLAATMADFSAGLIETFDDVEGKLDTTAGKLAAISGIISGISSIMQAAANARVAAIDKEIKAEEKRDGKSKQSLAKLKGLEAKKEQMKKRAFEQNKKMMIAQAVMSTAAGIAATLGNAADGPTPVRIALAALVGAMGMAQVALISRMQYEGGGAAGGVQAPSQVNIGERGNQVDVSQKASAGELAFLRGAKGIGSSATAFTPTGGAAGLRKGYADGGQILVGERGPEVITPLDPMQVWPGTPKQSSINANFTINAIDAAGVEDVLVEQQGNIISMIRSAANDHGEEFLEAINVDMYGTPKSAGGIDY